VSLLSKPGACTDRPAFWISSCGRCCSTGFHNLLPYAWGACGCWCCVSWRNAATKTCPRVVNLHKNFRPDDPLVARCVFFFAVLPSHGSNIDMILNEASLLPIVCNCSRSVWILFFIFVFRAIPMQVAATGL
jgi:hypothetical protein